MTDYTPTTEEVRGLYSMGNPEEIFEFDRWLAEVKAQAWQDGWYAKDTDVNPYREYDSKQY